MSPQRRPNLAALERSTQWASFANPDLEAVLTSAASLLAQRNWSLATAESCTGGLIAAACTEHAGASAWFERGFVCYSAAAKIEQLGVPAALLAKNGMVHEEVALAMAAGALMHSRAQVSVAVTGLAGPACDGSGQAVGTVCFAWGLNDNSYSETCVFAGSRAAVRGQAALHAMHRLVEYIRLE
jgi:nicotinamide-nucleotide amidase